MTCSRCRKKNPKGTLVCAQCGTALSIDRRKGAGKGASLIVILIVALAVILTGVLGYYFYQRSQVGSAGISSWGQTSAGGVVSEEEEAQVTQSATGTLQDTFIKYVSGPLSVKKLPRGDSDTVETVEDFLMQMEYYGEMAQGMFTWYRIRTESGAEGWVRGDRVVSNHENVKYPYGDGEGQDYVKFTENNVNIREAPADNSELVCQIKDCGVYLHACYEDGYEQGPDEDGQTHDWILVLVDSERSGWVRADQVTPVTGETDFDMERVYVKDLSVTLPLRAQPKQESALAAEIRKDDTRLYVVSDPTEEARQDGSTYTWYEVAVSSTVHGWARSDQVKRIAP